MLPWSWSLSLLLPRCRCGWLSIGEAGGLAVRKAGWLSIGKAGGLAVRT